MSIIELQYQEKALTELKITVDKIKNASPTSMIIVVGPFPEWRGGLIKLLERYYNKNKSLTLQYMRFGLIPEVKVWDDFFKLTIPRLNILYISPYDVFCNEAGCLTRTDDTVNGLITIDFGHLTKNGSIYFIEKVKNSIFLP